MLKHEFYYEQMKKARRKGNMKIGNALAIRAGELYLEYTEKRIKK